MQSESTKHVLGGWWCESLIRKFSLHRNNIPGLFPPCLLRKGYRWLSISDDLCLIPLAGDYLQAVTLVYSPYFSLRGVHTLLVILELTLHCYELSSDHESHT